MSLAKKRLSVAALAAVVALALALGGLGLTSVTPERAFADDTAAAATPAKTYTIKYKGVSGAKNANPTEVEKGKLKLKKPTKTGYTFQGWYQGTKKVTTLNVKKNTTVTAKWKAKTYKITYKNVKGTNKNAKKFTYGKSVKLKSLSKKGYTFKGWYTDAQFTKKAKTVGGKTAKNVTVYAWWIQNPKTASQKRAVSLAKAAYKQIDSEHYTTYQKMVDGLQRYGVSAKDAKFAAKNCGANYYTEAIKIVKYAKNMPELVDLDTTLMKNYLKNMMKEEGFTSKEINYAFKVVKF
ncbi:InlB B-repeat-containing protein [uncultured Adlercreutzia sp.]|uniref:InlB B-repeat-containing protein n=1 Tax=uncultured Adlercreutzia sp. TaxID=875803 RepID=UPI002614E220|nr:InlB B-repeat-containing protein [uncultured Adlercreutzia sp.]MCI9261767.1 InlB B-repeat-containing protein [Eggerthellaceae bacterium]